MPIVDTVNGFLLKGRGSSGIGTLYRLAFFALLFVYYFYNGCTKTDYVLVASFFLFLVFQVVSSLGLYVKNSLELTVKLFTPMFMAAVFGRMLRRGQANRERVCRLMDWLALLYPITILIPYALHMGYSTYYGNVGYKAFYFATNEITFAVCTMVMYLWDRLRQSLRPRWLLCFAMNGASCVLLGSKIAMAIFLFFAGLLVAENVFIAVRKNVIRSIAILSFAVIVGIVVLSRFGPQIARIIARWESNLSRAESGVAFLSSHRNVFLSNTFAIFQEKGIWTMLFGWGLGGTNSVEFVEMDLFDLIFSCGFIGTIAVFALYAVLLRRLRVRAFTGWMFFGIAMFISLLGGHVLFTGLGGMSFAMLLFYIAVIPRGQELCRERILEIRENPI